MKFYDLDFGFELAFKLWNLASLTGKIYVSFRYLC